jgi:hypothetical protein
MANNLFNPILGSEEKVLACGTSAGSVYFTTDTRKIYLDLDNEHAKMPMGGNVNLFYGNMILTSPPVDGQTEFEFKITEIVGNETGENILKPNVNDLILNTPDKSFYRVREVFVEEDYLTAEKLAIAGGSGGGSGGGGGVTPGMARPTIQNL